MIRIGTVWDRTVEVLQGRGGILATIALLTLFLPAVASGAFRSFTDPRSAAMMAGVPIGIVLLLLLVFGLLAITAVASDPAVDRQAAFRIAGRRLLPAIGVLFVVGLIIGLFAVPAAIAFAVSGATMNTAGAVNFEQAAVGRVLVFAILLLLSGLFALWIIAKLVPLLAVIIGEGMALRAIRRSFHLTRGATMKLIGFLILYLIVAGVLSIAATLVTGTVARIALGSEANGAVAFLVAVANAAVTAVTTVVQTVFYAQYYVAARAREEGLATTS